MKNSPSDLLSMITVIINEGRGSEVMSFAKERGAVGTVCFLGRGTVDNKMLRFLELDNVHKEVVMMYVPREIEERALRSIAAEFNLEQPRSGIAFSIPVIQIKDVLESNPVASNLSCVMLIVPVGNGDVGIETARGLGIKGATIIYAHGAASRTKRLFDLPIEAEKEIVLFVTQNSRVGVLQEQLTEKLHLLGPNSGVLAVFPVSTSIGLYGENEVGLPSGSADMAEIKGTAIVLHAVLGHDAEFFHAADKVGSRGGTVIHARGAAQAREGLFGAIEPEQEVLFIMTDSRHVEKIHGAVLQVESEMHVQPPQIALLPIITQTGLMFED